MEGVGLVPMTHERIRGRRDAHVSSNPNINRLGDDDDDEDEGKCPQLFNVKYMNQNPISGGSAGGI